MVGEIRNDHRFKNDILKYSQFDITVVLDEKLPKSNLAHYLEINPSLIHPDDIGQGLKTGEDYLATKVGKYNVERVIVKNNL
jgi:hypothetical protein